MTFRPHLTLLTAAAFAAFSGPAVADADGPRAAKLLADSTARAYPGQAAPRVQGVAARRPLTGAPTVLPVIGTATADGRPWLRVLLPSRPNGTSGWIPADGTASRTVRYRITVDRSQRRLTLTRAGKPVRSFRVVVGAASTPTPTGRFFVAERVRQPRGAQIGPWALATSAFSNVLRQFGGGPGQIALHGRTGLLDPLGSAASHGCVRLDDRAITWLARRAEPGTPITIRR